MEVREGGGASDAGGREGEGRDLREGLVVERRGVRVVVEGARGRRWLGGVALVGGAAPERHSSVVGWSGAV